MADDTQDNSSQGPSKAKIAAMETGNFLWDMFQARKRYKFEKKMQRHRDSIRRMGAAINDFAITRNAIWGEQDLRLKRLASTVQSMTAAGTMAVQTALSGFSGSTSNAVARSQAMAQDLEQRSYDRQQQRMQQSENFERLRNNWNTYTQMESIHAPVQKPDYVGMAIKGINNMAKDAGKAAATGGAGGGS